MMEVELFYNGLREEFPSLCLCPWNELCGDEKRAIQEQYLAYKEEFPNEEYPAR